MKTWFKIQYLETNKLEVYGKTSLDANFDINPLNKYRDIKAEDSCKQKILDYAQIN